MSTPTTPPSPTPAGNDRTATPVDAAPAVPSFEDKLREFWNDNRVAIFGFCVLVLVVITGKGLWEFYQVQRDNSIAADYAKASTNDQLKAFAASHSGHVLAGVATLRLADDAYTAGKFADAATLYGQAVPVVKTGPLVARAKIGAAVSKLQAGDRTGGETALKTLASDLSLPAGARAEATYHLASIAVEKGDTAGLQTLIEQLNSIAPQSLWSQRALLLRAESTKGAPAAVAPEAPAAVPAAGAPTVTFPKGK
ncbi:MAG: tetratricopeptide repeat protein [Opitutaceae bacterium]|nr:tetratricopeptide repeat protein [Opitutaceae bacterium]